MIRFDFDIVATLGLLQMLRALCAVYSDNVSCYVVVTVNVERYRLLLRNFFLAKTGWHMIQTRQCHLSHWISQMIEHQLYQFWCTHCSYNLTIQ